MATINTSGSVTSELSPSVPIEEVTHPTPSATSSPTDGVNQELAASQVLATFLPRYQALAVDELMQINADIPTVVTSVLGALPEIRSYRSQILRDMASYDIELFDLLEGSAIALNDAHGNYQVAVEASTELQELLTEASALRETLFTDATSLAHRGLLDAKRLTELKGSVGYRNLAADLNVLWKALDASWPKIVGKCATTEAELARAEKLQLRLMRLLGEKEQGAPSIAAVTELRQRAFTYFIRCYDHVRRAIYFLRWKQGDADSIAPSLYAGRGTGKRKKESAAASNGSAGSNGVVPGTAGSGTAAPGTGTAVAGNALTNTAGSGAGVQPGLATLNPNAPHAETDPFLS